MSMKTNQIKDINHRINISDFITSSRMGMALRYSDIQQVQKEMQQKRAYVLIEALASAYILTNHLREKNGLVSFTLKNQNLKKSIIIGFEKNTETESVEDGQLPKKSFSLPFVKEELNQKYNAQLIESISKFLTEGNLSGSSCAMFDKSSFEGVLCIGDLLSQSQNCGAYQVSLSQIFNITLGEGEFPKNDNDLKVVCSKIEQNFMLEQKNSFLVVKSLIEKKLLTNTLSDSNLQSNNHLEQDSLKEVFKI